MWLKIKQKLFFMTKDGSKKGIPERKLY
jgi:hypothetical protein